MIHLLNTNDGKEIAVPNYEYKIGEMDGKDMRSIFERWKDKRTQEKDMEVNNEKNIYKSSIFIKSFYRIFFFF